MSGADPNAATGLAEGLEPADAGPSGGGDLAPDLERDVDPKARVAGRLETSARLAADRDPAQHAKVIQMADYTGLDRSMVERNPEKAKSLAAQQSVDVQGVTMHSPALAEWLSNFDNMAVARNDIKGLQGLEWWTGRAGPSGEVAFSGAPRTAYSDGALSHAVRVGTQQREQAEIGWNALLSGTDPDSHPRVAEIDKFLAQDYGKESHGVVARAVASGLEQVGPMGSAFASGAAMGAVAGAAASQAGPGAPITVPLATSAGTFAGIGYDTMKQEAGAAYIENIRADKARGVPPNYRSAAIAASIAGAANAAIEIGGSKLAVAFMPFLGPLFGEAKTASFGGMTLKKAVARTVAGYVGTLLEESSTESAQRGVTELTAESRAAMAGAPTSFGSIPKKMGEEFVGALWGMAALVLPGAAGQFSEHLAGIRDGKRNVERVSALGSIAANLDLAKSSPEMLADFADKAQAANLAPPHVLVHADAWTALFQSKGIDPAVAAAQIGVEKAYTDSKETGGFIAVPFGTYVSKIAANVEYNAALAKDVKFYQDGKTGREAEDGAKALDAMRESMAEETIAATTKSPVYQNRFNQLAAVRTPGGARMFSDTEADHYARLHEAYFKTQAQRTGLTMEQLGSLFPLSIQAGEVMPGPNVTLNQPARVSIQDRIDAIDAAHDAVRRTEIEGGLRPGETEAQRLDRLGEISWRQWHATQALRDQLAWTSVGLTPPKSAPTMALPGPDNLIDPSLGIDSQRKLATAVVGEWQAGGLDFNAAHDEVVRLKESNQITGVQESMLLGEISKHYYPTKQSEGRAAIILAPSIGSTDLDAKLSAQRQTMKLNQPSGGASEANQGFTFEPAGQIDRPGKEPIRYWKANKPMPITGDVGRVTDEMIRKNGLTPPGEATLAQPNRGSITFSRAGAKGGATNVVDKFLSRFGVVPREFTITFSPNADLSTFLHETGHYFLETFADLAYSDNATDQTRADFEKLLDWFGVKTRDDITNAHHEKFARAFESYLQEGKPPAPGLVRTFARFSAWLKSIYRDLVGQGADLTPEVRGVMDRMIATDDQIQAVSQGALYIPMFRNAEEAGMRVVHRDGTIDDSRFDEYNAKAEQAHGEDRAILAARIATDQRRETLSWWREERAKVAEGIAARINAERPVQAYRYLAEGKIPEGADPQVFADENGQPFRLSLAVIDAEYPGLQRTIRAEIGRRGTTKTGGIHPTHMGALFGYGSGDEFLQALVTMDPPDRRIARETQAAMIARHGDILHDGTLPQAAEEAARESTARLTQLLQELDALNKKAGNPRVRLTKEDLESAAFKDIRAGKVRDLDPASYRQAERQAATNAIRANRAGKYDEAVEWQRRRVLNFALSREAATAKKQAESAARFLERSDNDATRAKLGKAGGTYQEQQDRLLARFDFGRRSLKAIDKSQALQDWVIEQQAAHFDPIIPKKLLDEAFKTNWKDMSVNDLLALRDAVKSIQYTADRKNSLIVAGKNRAYDATIDQATEALHKNVADPGDAVISRTLGGVVRGAKALHHEFDAFNARLEEFALQMDGGDPNGIWAQILVHPFADSQAADMDLGLEVARDVLKAYEALPEKMRIEIQTRKVYIKSIRQTFTFKDLLGVASNYGNPSNYGKMLDGYAGKHVGLVPWTPETIEEILWHLDEAHWDYVQNVGDILQKLWPAAEALERRLTGLAPPEVAREPFTRTFKDGRKKTYDGYYFPIMPHPDFAKQFAEKSGPDGGPYEPWHTRASTPHGHLIERTGAVYPIDLNFLRVPGHIAQVIHDTTHRENVINAWRFLNDPQLSEEIKHRMSLPNYQEMLSRVRKIANARGMLDFEGDRLGWAEAQMASYLMGWKVTTASQNFANLGIAINAVGAPAFANAVAEFKRDMKGTLEFIHASSGEMRHRFRTRDNETRREFERAIVGEEWDAIVRRTGYYLASFTNSLIDQPLWLAQYQIEIARGLTHEAASRSADSKVRTELGAGGVKDLAHYQDSPLWKHLTMFTGWFSSQYNAQRRVIRETRGLYAEGKYANAAAHFFVDQFFRIAFMAVASEVLSGRGPKDGEKAWRWALSRIALYQISLAPIIKDLASAFDFGTDPRFGGIGSVAGLVLDSVKADVKAGKRGTLPAIGKAVSANAKLLALSRGWPGAQADVTLGFLGDVAFGTYRPAQPWSPLVDPFFRRDKKERDRR